MKYNNNLTVDEIIHYAELGLLEADNWNEVVVKVVREFRDERLQEKYNEGHIDGYNSGIKAGYDDGFDEGYDQGLMEGRRECSRD